MKNLFKLDIKAVVAIGIGAALFIVLSYVQIPTPVPNTAIHSRVGVLAFFAAIFGPIVGGLIGLIGHALADALMYGSVWWSWVFASAVMGFGIGLFANLYKISSGSFSNKRIVIFNAIQVLVNIVSWGLIAPTLDVWIYAEPADKVYLQGITSIILNIIAVGVITTILAIIYSKALAGTSSLSKDK